MAQEKSRVIKSHVTPAKSEDFAQIANRLKEALYPTDQTLLFSIYSGGVPVGESLKEAMETAGLQCERYVLYQIPASEDLNYRDIVGYVPDYDSLKAQALEVATSPESFERLMKRVNKKSYYEFDFGNPDDAQRIQAVALDALIRIYLRPDISRIGTRQGIGAVVADDDIHRGLSIVGGIIYVLEHQPDIGYDKVFAVVQDDSYVTNGRRGAAHYSLNLPIGNNSDINRRVENLNALVRERAPMEYQELTDEGLTSHLYRFPVPEKRGIWPLARGLTLW